MALDFPSNPTNGQVFQDYFWDAATGAWRGIGSPNNLGVQVGQLRTASPITVANQAARDALIPAPVQGNSVYRTDLGVTQTYYGLFNASTNPGGRDVAGWYNTEKSIGLVPISPSSVVVAGGGSGSANSLGLVSFSSATSVSLNNVFSSEYKSYRIIIDAYGTSLGTQLLMRLRASGADRTTSYFYAGRFERTAGAGGVHNANGAVAFDLNRIPTSSGNSSGTFVDVLTGPSKAPKVFWQSYGEDSSSGIVLFGNGINTIGANSDGFTIYCAAGYIAGDVQVFGYND